MTRFCDELAFGFGWIAPEERRARTSHALAAAGAVWLIDVVEAPGTDERVRALGEPRAVIQLLDRHKRDCAATAARLGVPHLVVPAAGIPDSPFEVVPVVRVPLWREIALWWRERRVLVCADALGTAPFFVAPGERLGVHPLLRLTPPRALGRLEPRHVLCGHGEGVHGAEATAAVRQAVATARRRLPALVGSMLRHSGRAVRPQP